MSISNLLAVVAALIHVYIFVLESFRWEHPKTLKTFRMSADQARISNDLAFNQGFYNLFLALAIVVGLLTNQKILLQYGMASILAAAVVLIVRKPKMLRGAMIQGLPAALYFIVQAL